MKELNEYFDANRRLWDNKTQIHVKSDFYNMEGFMKGESSLRKLELGVLGDLSGKKLLHTQCHFGQDTLSLQRMGAECTGVDFSDKAVAQANALNTSLDLGAHFVCCNVLEMDQNIEELFDVVYTSYGVVTWLPNLNDWAEQISKRIKVGGTFYMIEFHPVLYMFEWEEDIIKYNYFNPGKPVEEIEQGTYADKNADIAMKEYWWSHSLEAILNSLIKNGFAIKEFKEYDYSPYEIFGGTGMQRADQEYVFKHNNVSIPHVFSVVAEKL